jgi:hypothetical protein
LLTAGLSNGGIQIIDCASAKVQSSQASGSHGKVLAICHLRNSASQLLISTEDSYALYDWKDGKAIDTISSKKKGVPTLLDVSHDD